MLKQVDIDCFILDDGYQHVRLNRDVNLLLVDGSDSSGLKKLLPAGRLREPLSAASRATAVVITRADLMTEPETILDPIQGAIGQSIVPIQVEFQPQKLSCLSTNEHQPIGWAYGKRALIFSGIGNAKAFRSTVARMGVTILEEMVFPDHCSYGVTDLEAVRERMRQVKASCALTTEKDSVKLTSFIKGDDDIWAIDLKVEIKHGEDRLAEMLNKAYEGAKSDSG